MSNGALFERVHFILQAEVAARLGLDPLALELTALENGIASVRLSEACASCPASLPLLIAQMESELRERVPEVEIVEVVA